jgi:hypothetical protein
MWGGAFALPLAFRPASRAEDMRAPPYDFGRFVESGAERKLGGSAEALAPQAF